MSDEKYGTDLGHAAVLVSKWQRSLAQLEQHIIEHYVHIGSITEQQARDALKAIGVHPKRIADWFELNPAKDDAEREGMQLVANDPDRMKTFDELQRLHERIVVSKEATQ